MASTTPSAQVQTSTIVLGIAGALSLGVVGYALWFDHRRRYDVEFRKKLKRQSKKASKEQQEAAKAAERSQKDRIREAVAAAREEGFPRNPDETEQYFMREVGEGEKKCQDGSDPVDAALCFYRALKVYPQPRDLMDIYDKTVPKVSCFVRCCPDGASTLT